MEATIQSDPKWHRMPTPGQKLGGLSRNSIYRGIESGCIRGRGVKLSPDAKRSIPYVSLADIEALIEGAPSMA